MDVWDWHIAGENEIRIYVLEAKELKKIHLSTIMTANVKSDRINTPP